MKQISEEKLEEMFEHYIERRCKAIDASGYDEMWICGEADECKRWLELFGVDVSYNRVQPLVDKMYKENN